jgi:hypothetical protein
VETLVEGGPQRHHSGGGGKGGGEPGSCVRTGGGEGERAAEERARHVFDALPKLDADRCSIMLVARGQFSGTGVFFFGNFYRVLDPTHRKWIREMKLRYGLITK